MPIIPFRQVRSSVGRTLAGAYAASIATSESHPIPAVRTALEISQKQPVRLSGRDVDDGWEADWLILIRKWHRLPDIVGTASAGRGIEDA